MENILVALRGIEGRWDSIGKKLYVPCEIRMEIWSQHSTDSDRLRAVLLYALTLHPRSSWRCVISALHGMRKYQVAELIQDYSEPVTGMLIRDMLVNVPYNTGFIAWGAWRDANTVFALKPCPDPILHERSGGLLYELTTVGRFLIASIYCELWVFPAFAINKFANINVRIYYNMVQGWPLQLLDSLFGLTCLERNR